MKYNDVVTLIETVANAANPSGVFMHGRKFDASLEFNNVWPQIHLYPFKQRKDSNNENIIISEILMGFWQEDGHENTMQQKQAIIAEMDNMAIAFENAIRLLGVQVLSFNKDPEYNTLISVASGVSVGFSLVSGVGCDDTPLILCRASELLLNGIEFLTVASGTTQDILLLDQDDAPVTPLSVVGNTIKVTQGGGVLITNSDDTFSVTATPPTFKLPDTDYNININGVFYASTSLPTLAP